MHEKNNLAKKDKVIFSLPSRGVLCGNRDKGAGGDGSRRARTEVP